MFNPGDTAIGVALLPPATITTTTTGAAIDLLGYDGEAILVLNAAASGVGAAAVKLTHSDTSGGTYTDVGAAFADVTNAASFQLVSINTDEIKRFVKAVATISGSSPSQLLSVGIVGWPKSF